MRSFLFIRVSRRGNLARYSCQNRAEANERMAILKDLGTGHIKKQKKGDYRAFFSVICMINSRPSPAPATEYCYYHKVNK
jgi:hypothetical protein